jgi:hypothetical protein
MLAESQRLQKDVSFTTEKMFVFSANLTLFGVETNVDIRYNKLPIKCNKNKKRNPCR